ncbi:MAG: class I SAM-dependent methyltransferase [Solirubrobacteraceae bacterium]
MRDATTGQRDDGVPRAFWDRVSRQYDRQLRLERAAIRITVELLAPQREDRVLDVGTGTGVVLRQLAGESSRPREAIGLDTSARMLARVPELPAGWSVTVADALALPFDACELDAATACYLLHVLPAADRLVVLTELRRVLRPGGHLAVVTPAIAPRGWGRPIAWLLDRLAAYCPIRYGGLRALDPRPALQQAGFEILETRWSTRGYVSICVLARRPEQLAATGPTVGCA